MTEIMRPFFLCGKGSQIFPRTWVFFFLETKLGYMLPILLNFSMYWTTWEYENREYSAPLVECRDFSVCQRACALIVRTIVHLFCAIWTPQCGGKRESCVYSSAKINLLFRIEEVFAKQFSVFLRTVVVIDKNKWTFFRLLSCFVSFLASFGGKRAPFLLAPSAVAPRVCRYA